MKVTLVWLTSQVFFTYFILLLSVCDAALSDYVRLPYTAKKSLNQQWTVNVRRKKKKKKTLRAAWEILSEPGNVVVFPILKIEKLVPYFSVHYFLWWFSSNCTNETVIDSWWKVPKYTYKTLMKWKCELSKLRFIFFKKFDKATF